MLIYSTVAFVVLLITNNVFSSNNIIQNDTINIQLLNILRSASFVSLFIYAINFNHKNMRIWFLVPVIIEFILVFNPFSGVLARYILFVMYLSIVLYLFRNTKASSWIFLTFIILFCFMFTNSRHNVGLNSLFSVDINFKHVDFDAYQMLLSTIQHTKTYGVSYGMNIIFSLMFLIPRSFAPFKSLPTGVIVFTSSNNSFTNVSCPFISEAYYAFGLFGVMIFAIFAGVFSKKMDTFLYSNNYIVLLFTYIVLGMIIYICRGALLNCIAFLGGILLGLVPFIFIINKFSKSSFRRLTIKKVNTFKEKN